MKHSLPSQTFPLCPFPPCPWSRPQIWLEGLRSIVSSHWCGQSAANKRFLVHFWVKNHALHDSTIAKVVRQSDMHCYSYWSCNILVWYFSKSNCTVPLSALTIAYNRNITMRGPVSKKVERLRPQWEITTNATLTYMRQKIISKLFQPLSTSVWNNFAWNYFKIISQAYCSSWLFANMFIVAEIILK